MAQRLSRWLQADKVGLDLPVFVTQRLSPHAFDLVDAENQVCAFHILNQYIVPIVELCRSLGLPKGQDSTVFRGYGSPPVVTIRTQVLRPKNGHSQKPTDLLHGGGRDWPPDLVSPG